MFVVFLDSTLNIIGLLFLDFQHGSYSSNFIAESLDKCPEEDKSFIRGRVRWREFVYLFIYFFTNW